MKFFKVAESDCALTLEFCAFKSSNAFSLDAARELDQCRKANSKNSKPLIVISGHPRLFCSGGNLSDYKKLKGKATGLKVNREIESILNAFAKWPAPKLALIEGDVLGGGMEWLARFDFRWAVPHSLFAFWQKRIGLSTGWGGGKVWSQKIGEDQVRQMLIEGRLMSAAEAYRRGLIDCLVSAWKIREEAEEWAAVMQSATTGRLGQWQSSRERAIFSSLWMAPEHAAVLAKWKGRS